MQAAAVAKARGMPIYTIGAGKDGIVPFPVFDDKGNRIGYRRILADLDENSLRDIANLTGGHFFRAAEPARSSRPSRTSTRAKKIDFQARSYLLTTRALPLARRPRARLLALAALRARVPGAAASRMTFAWPHIRFGSSSLAARAPGPGSPGSCASPEPTAAPPSPDPPGRGRGSVGSASRPRPGAAGRRSRPRAGSAPAWPSSIVALARPQWGRIDEPVFEQSREIVIALDLSRSMQTPDVKPTRLERAKLLIESLLDRLTGERVGLVVFSGTAFLQSPLSADYEILREFLPSLGSGLHAGGRDRLRRADRHRGRRLQHRRHAPTGS